MTPTSLKPVDSDSYETVYAKRRLARLLNPEATQMYAFQVESKEESSSILARLLATRLQPLTWLRSFGQNISHLFRQLGLWGAGLLVTGSVINFVGRRPTIRSLSQRPVLLWAGVYLAGLSLVASKIPRYTMVLVPFIVVIVAESVD